MNLKKKMQKIRRQNVFAPADRAANYVVIIWNRYYVDLLKGE